MKALLEWTNRQSLSTKLRWANLITSGAVIFVFAAFLLGIQAYFFTSSLLGQTRAEAAMASENLSAAMVFGDRKAANDILAALHTTSEVRYALVYDAGGRLFASYLRSGNDDVEFVPADLSMPGYAISFSHLGVQLPFDFQGARLGTIVVNSDLGGVHRQLVWYVAIILPLMIAVLALGNIVLSRLQNAITEPILALSRTSEQISRKGDYSLRASVNPAADIGMLATAFNSMLERIEKRETELEAEIMERRRVETKLDRLAHFDNVTGLHNRHFFNERLQAVVSRAHQFNERAVLMFIDLDNFKTVNDTLGHATGDELLRVVSSRLAETLRFGDVLSRIGGDEFAILLENVALASVGGMVAEKCLAALAEPIRIDGNEIHVSASIGISIYPDDASDMHELLKYADTAMYYAKNSGKNAYRSFAPSMQGEAQKRFAIDNSLRRALERGEFMLHYQPQIDLRTERIIGVEALLRWAHPEQGMVSPADFIPVAEETGLIVPIGEWVLRTACRQLKEWHDGGLVQLQMAVNLSGRQLQEAGFVATVLGIVSASGIDPRYLELELTESMLMDARPGTLDKLHELRSAGIELAIDDFGTGYSSMSYLKTFPIGTLKVDRSFVRDLPGNFEDAAITKAIIAMAHSLKMDVIAEGIETAAQADFLRAHGRTSCQGFLYGRPVPPAQIRELLERQNSTLAQAI